MGRRPQHAAHHRLRPRRPGTAGPDGLARPIRSNGTRSKRRSWRRKLIDDSTCGRIWVSGAHFQYSNDVPDLSAIGWIDVEDRTLIVPDVTGQRGSQSRSSFIQGSLNETENSGTNLVPDSPPGGIALDDRWLGDGVTLIPLQERQKRFVGEPGGGSEHPHILVILSQ